MGGSTQEEDVIRFYRVSDEYGCFSNFARYPIRLKGQTWPTSEHYFQAQKFAGTVHEKEIRKAESPMIAARMGRDRSKKIRNDWDSISVSVMRDAVMAKFAQHPDIRTILLSTGDARIVEHTSRRLPSVASGESHYDDYFFLRAVPP